MSDAPLPASTAVRMPVAPPSRDASANTAMRILLITPSTPFPPDNGTRQRTHLLYRGLSRVGAVDFALVSPGPVPVDDADRAVLTERFGYLGQWQGREVGQRAPWSALDAIAGRRAANLAAHALTGWQSDFWPDRRARRWLEQKTGGRAYDLIVSRYLWPAAHLGFGANDRLLIDIDDFESQRLESQLAIESWSAAKQRWWARRVRQTRRYEQRYLQQVSHAFVAKPQDAEGIVGPPVSLLPNVPFIEGDAVPEPLPDASASRTILFIGTLEYGPNVRAMQRLIDHAWPKIKAGCPEARLRIAGGGLEPARREAWAAVPGVEPIGYVSEVAEAYRDAAFSIVPIWEGAGTKIKLAESLLWGRTVVCARHSLAGYEQHLSHGEHVWVADDDAQLAEGCIALLNDAPRRAALAEAGRSAVLDHYTPASFYATVEATVDRLLNETDVR